MQSATQLKFEPMLFRTHCKRNVRIKSGQKPAVRKVSPPDIDLLVTFITGLVRQAAVSTAILCQSSRPLSSIYVDFILRKPPFAALV